MIRRIGGLGVDASAETVVFTFSGWSTAVYRIDGGRGVRTLTTRPNATTTVRSVTDNRDQRALSRYELCPGTRIGASIGRP